MARKPSAHPTELELEILKVVWNDSPLTARQIRDELEISGRALAYSSVITTVQKMVDKGQLRQLEPVEGKAFRFSPRIQERTVNRNILKDVAGRFFNGSAEAVVLSLFDATELSDADLKRLRNVINRKLRGTENE